MRLQKVSAIFPPPLVCSDLANEIRNTREFGSLKFMGGHRVFFIAPTVEDFPVQFTANKVVVESIAKHVTYKNQPTAIQKMILIAMERFAQELNWGNSVHHLCWNAVDYHFYKGSQEPLTWHSDFFRKEAHYSFITYLSDPQDKVCGWSGGDVLYTAARHFNLSDLEQGEREKVCQLGDQTEEAIFNDPSYPIWRISPSQNDAILFGNLGMRHRVTPMSPLQEQSSRMIFTIFDFGTPAAQENQQYW